MRRMVNFLLYIYHTGDAGGAQRNNGRSQFCGELLPDLRYLFTDILQLRADVFQLRAQLIETVLGQLQLLGDELQRLRT